MQKTMNDNYYVTPFGCVSVASNKDIVCVTGKIDTLNRLSVNVAGKKDLVFVINKIKILTF